MANIIGKELISKATGVHATIENIDKKGIYTDVGFGSPIFTSYQKSLDVFYMDEETENEIKYLSEHAPVIKKNTGEVKSRKVNNYGTKNIAFKLNYCDGGKENNGIGFAGVCSYENMIRNQQIHSANSWCNVGPCSKCTKGEITVEQMLNSKENPFVCYETRTFIDWKGFAGEDTVNGQMKPRRILQAAPKCIAVLTTVLPNSDTRNIIGLFYVNNSEEGDGTYTGYVEADPKYRILFTENEARKLDFWKYYSNPNHPEDKKWGSGLVRYPLNSEVLNMLDAALEIKKGTKDEGLIKELIELFKKEKNIEE